MKVIGYYWWIWAGGERSVEWTKSPYYAIRNRCFYGGLGPVKQILVKGIGEKLQWINISPRDLEPLK